MTVNSESGFSLLELLLAAALTVGLMGMVFSIANQNQGVFVTESGVTDMNQNARSAMDMLTRDLQSAGMGLRDANFAAIYYINGTGANPDGVLMLNGDPFAPTALVTAQAGTTFTVARPQEVPVPTPTSGSSQVYRYAGEDTVQTNIYDDFTADPRRYIVYDSFKAMTFTLSTNGTSTAADGNTAITLTRSATNFVNPATVFGAPALDQGAPPVYTNQTKVAVLNSTIAYRLNMATHELERTENLTDWFPIARGILSFQIRYRLVRYTGVGASEEVVTDAPGDGVTQFPSATLTSRADIASLIITIGVETPDVDVNSRSYRRVVHRFEVTPRNLSMGRGVVEKI